MKRARHRYRRALIREMRGRWWRCFWTWPLGHSYVGNRECEFCGKPRYLEGRDVHELEHLYERRLGLDGYSLSDEEAMEILPPRILRAAKAYAEAE